jgi:hypothetical protein
MNRSWFLSLLGAAPIATIPKPIHTPEPRHPGRIPRRDFDQMQADLRAIFPPYVDDSIYIPLLARLGG